MRKSTSIITLLAIGSVLVIGVVWYVSTSPASPDLTPTNTSGVSSPVTYAGGILTVRELKALDPTPGVYLLHGYVNGGYEWSNPPEELTSDHRIFQTHIVVADSPRAFTLADYDQPLEPDELIVYAESFDDVPATKGYVSMGVFVVGDINRQTSARSVWVAKPEEVGRGDDWFMPRGTGCEDIADETQCNARQDCMTVDTCSCYSQNSKNEKCGLTDTQVCTCLEGDFVRCEPLTCDLRTTLQFPTGYVSTQCRQDSDCRLVALNADVSDCCVTEPACTDRQQELQVAVNAESFELLHRRSVQLTCDAMCMSGERTACEHPKRQAVCRAGTCQTIVMD